MISWPFDPTVYVGILVLYFGHAALARQAGAERKHSLYFGLGLITLWVALETPIDSISDYYLESVHMLQHVLLAYVAPPLMLLGLSPGMVDRLIRVPGLRAITEPLPAQIFAGLVMVVWHLPPLYDATLYNEGLHVSEHVMFIASGVVLYWPIIDVTASHAQWRMSPGAKLVYLLVATLPQDGVALPLIFSRVAFYEYYTHAPRLIEGFTAAIDQTIGGAVLMIFGKLTMAIAALVIFFRWFGEEQRMDRLRLTRSGVH